MHTVFVDSLRKQEITVSHEKGSTSFSFSVLLFFCWGKYSFNIEKCKSLCWGTGFSLTIKKKKGISDRSAMRFYSTNVPSDTPIFPWVAALWQYSVFTAAGSLSAVFTHITGVKEVDFTMRCSGSWQLVSRCCQNPEATALCDGRSWDIRVSLYRVNELQWSGAKLEFFVTLATTAWKVTLTLTAGVTG